jgi:hypothetical protein
MEEGRRMSALAMAAKDKSERRENFMVLEIERDSWGEISRFVK